MIVRPFGLGGAAHLAWRLDRADFADAFASGEGARRAGGRWNSKGRRAVYASIDAATAILEVAVHKGFHVLDTLPHVLTAFEVADLADVHVVDPESLPNSNWLRPGLPSLGQREHGDRLLAEHVFVAFPSTVAPHGWNLVFDPERAAGRWRLRRQEPFALDGRLHPPP